jgi:hypothetical protein
MTRPKASVRRCSWHHCAQPAAAAVAFELPNLLAGSRRDYCREHSRQVRLAKGTVVVARFGPRRQSVLPGHSDTGQGRLAEPKVASHGKEVMP